MAVLVKTLNGLAYSAVKARDGLVVGSISKINGLDATAPSGSTPVGWWKLNEGSGTTAADSSGNGNTGTLINGPTWSTGPGGTGALDFSSVLDQYVNVGNGTSLNITGAISISFWANIATIQDQQFVAKDAAIGGRAYTFDMQATGAHGFRFYINGSSAVETGANPSAGVWYFLAGTYDPSVGGGTLQIYQDSVLMNTSIGAGTSINTASTDVLLARRGFIGFTQPLDGSLDDVRIYDLVLSAGEISALYVAGPQ